MEKRFRDILPMPNVKPYLVDVVKETSKTLIIQSEKYGFREEYTFYKSLETYLKEKTALKDITSYLRKPNDDYHVVISQINVEKTQIEVAFFCLVDTVEINVKNDNIKNLTQDHILIIESVVKHTEDFLKKHSKNRLRYLYAKIIHGTDLTLLLRKKIRDANRKKEKR